MGDQRYIQVYVQSQFICAILMIIIYSLTLIKVVYSTMHVLKHYTILLIVLSLGITTWLMVLLSNYFDGLFLTAVLYQTNTLQNIEIWIFAWTYYIGIYEHCNQ